MSTTKWQPNDSQRAILEALKRESELEGNVAAFCRNYATFGDSKFSKIMDALDPKAPKSYFDDIKDKNGLMEDLEEWLEKLPRLRLEKEQAKDCPLYDLTTFRACNVSIRDCKNKATPERITKYIAPTGGNKSMLRRYLEKKLRNEIAFAYVECRESWKPTSRDARARAKKTALMDICRAFPGFKLDSDTRAGGLPAIEDALINFCAQTQYLLFFDEAEFFSAYTLNLVKTLLNKTRLVVLIACTPRAHRKWNKYYADEADQIARRTNAVVQVSTISEADAKLFFPDDQFAKPEEALGLITKAASTFGHYSLIARIAEILQRSNRSVKKEVEAAIESAIKQMGREDWEGNAD